MNKNFSFDLADTVEMKKPHACQTNNLEVMRVGADIRLKCMGCVHVVMMSRGDFTKRAKKVLTKANDPVNRKLAHYVAKEEIARPNFK